VAPNIYGLAKFQNIGLQLVLPARPT